MQIFHCFTSHPVLCNSLNTQWEIMQLIHAWISWMPQQFCINKHLQQRNRLSWMLLASRCSPKLNREMIYHLSLKNHHWTLLWIEVFAIVTVSCDESFEFTTFLNHLSNINELQWCYWARCVVALITWQRTTKVNLPFTWQTLLITKHG